MNQARDWAELRGQAIYGKWQNQPKDLSERLKNAFLVLMESLGQVEQRINRLQMERDEAELQLLAYKRFHSINNLDKIGTATVCVLKPSYTECGAYIESQFIGLAEVEDDALVWSGTHSPVTETDLVWVPIPHTELDSAIRLEYEAQNRLTSSPV